MPRKVMKNFPKTVTVKIEPDNDADYLLAEPGTNFDAYATMGDKIKVGVYQLVEVIEVEGVAKTRHVSKPR